jgi:excisionase family DNA binding protein
MVELKETGNKADVVARYLGCSEYTVRQLAREGALPFYRVGNRMFFRKLSIEKWIEEKEAASLKVRQG